MSAPDFGELRSAAHRASRESWAAIRGSLERAQRAGHGQWVEEQALPYLRGALRAWPDEQLHLPNPLMITGREVDSWPVWFELVRHIDLSHAAPWMFGAMVVDLLLRTPLLQGASFLSLSGRRVNGRELDRLVSSPRFGSVRSFDLTLCALGDEGVELLARHAPALDELILDKNGIGAIGSRTLAGSDWLSSIDRLSLAGNAELDSVALLRSPMLRAPRALDLSGCRVGAQAIEALVGARWLHELEELGLSDNTLRPELVSELLAAPMLGALRVLSLRGAPLGSVWLPTITERRSLRSLERLDLSSCMLRNPDVRLLAHSGEWPHLRALNLSSNAITDAAILDIAQSARWPRLEYLGLYHCRFASRSTIAKLKESPGLPSLETISR